MQKLYNLLDQLGLNSNGNLSVFFLREDDGETFDSFSQEIKRKLEIIKPEDRQIHFAIECKLIENGFSEYVSDINKMSSRNFNTSRLPFEGQIGYILNKNYTNIHIQRGINNLLENKKEIIATVKELTSIEIHPDFNASYSSTHWETTPVG